MNHIINIFRDRCSVLVYMSDHGDDIYDTGDNLGRKIDMHVSYEIPFVIWCSEKYKKRHADIYDAMLNAVDRPLMSDNICHLLMRLGGVKSVYYHEKRDVLSSHYQCPPRIIAGRWDYDLLRRQNKFD